MTKQLTFLMLGSSPDIEFTAADHLADRILIAYRAGRTGTGTGGHVAEIIGDNGGHTMINLEHVSVLRISTPAGGDNA